MLDIASLRVLKSFSHGGVMAAAAPLILLLTKMG